MFKLGVVLLLIVAVFGSYSEAFGDKLCKLTVASYCRKAEV